MTKTELNSLWKTFKKTNKQEKRNKLIEYYYSLVKKIARTVSKKINYKVSSDELASHGVDGLFKAIEKFDLNRNIKFETYAYSRIKGSMIDGLRSNDWVPRSVRIRQSKIEKAIVSIETETGEKAKILSAVEKLGINTSEYIKNPKKFKASICSSIDTSTCLGDEENVKKDFNKYLESNVLSPDIKIIRREFLSKFLGKGLRADERMIVYLYYYEKLTMREISLRLRTTESHISQRHKAILKKIKNKISKNQQYLKEFKEIFSCKDKLI